MCFLATITKALGKNLNFVKSTKNILFGTKFSISEYMDEDM